MEPKSIIDIIYTLVIVSSCALIFLRTKKLYDLSAHRGIKAFRDTFLFFGIAFIINYAIILLSGSNLPYSNISFFGGISLEIIFYYCLSMAGFSLAYSLVWKNLEDDKIFILHIVALVISLLNVFVINTIMYITQIAVLSYATMISYSNHKAARNKGKPSFMQLYFIGLVLALLGYTTNFISGILRPLFPWVYLYTYIITISVFLIFLYGVMKVGRWQKKEKD